MGDNANEVSIAFRVTGLDGVKEAVDGVNEKISSLGQGGGDAENVKKLGEHAEGAGKSFETLKASAEGALVALQTGSLESVVSVLGQVGQGASGITGQFGAIGESLGFLGKAVGEALAVFGAVETAQYKLGESAAKSVNEFNALAEAAGVTGKQFATIERVFGESGVGAERLGLIIKTMSRRMQDEWGAISQAVRDSADQQESAILKIHDAMRALELAQQRAAAAPRATAAAARNLVSAKDAVQEEGHTETNDRLSLAKAKIDYANKYEHGVGVTPGDLQQVKDLEQKAAKENISRLSQKVDEGPMRREEALDKQAAAEDAVETAKRGELEAIDAVTKATIALTAAQNAQKDALLKDPAHLAASLKAGGGDVAWDQVASADMLKAIMVQTHGQGVPGLLEGVHGFVTNPNISSEAQEALGAQIIPGRQGLAQGMRALRKGGFTNITAEDERTGGQMDANKKIAENFEESEEYKNRAIRGNIIGLADKYSSQEVAAGLNRVLPDKVSGGIEKTVDTASDVLGRIASTGQGVVDVFSSIKNVFDLKAVGALPGEGAANTAAGRAAAIRGNRSTVVEEADGGGGMADGGVISGPGGPTDDQVPILASPGEYVVKAAAVNRVGVDFMHALNAGRFADGGEVRRLAEGGDLEDDPRKVKDHSFSFGRADAEDHSFPYGHPTEGFPPAQAPPNPDNPRAAVPDAFEAKYQGVAAWKPNEIPAFFGGDPYHASGKERAALDASNRETFSHLVKTGVMSQERANALLAGEQAERAISDEFVGSRKGLSIDESNHVSELRHTIWKAVAGSQSEGTQPDLSTPFSSLPPTHLVHSMHRTVHHHHRHPDGGGSAMDWLWGDNKFASGGLVGAATSAGGQGVNSIHLLDLRTDGGDFRTNAGADVVAAISQSAIAGRMTSQGSPSWKG